MPVQDTSKIKDKIVSFLRVRGPNLPVYISREIESSILFTSAFLSELMSEKRIKTSHMKVGNSPVYFIPGQENLLEKFAEHLRSKEKEAFSLLKEKKFLKDSEQDPAIRVALRSIRDFAIPFKKNEDIMWRYLTAEENNFETPKFKDVEVKPVKKEPEKNLEIFDKTPIKKPEKDSKKPKKKTSKRKSAKNDKFFGEIKEFLDKNSIELKDIVSFGKTEISLVVIENNKEKLLVAFNKRKISEKDIAKANKQSSELNLEYIVLSKGGMLKKIENLIEDLKNFSSLKILK